VSLLLALQLVYPATLAWTGFWRSNYVAAPWPGTTTAGLSAGRDLASVSGTRDPSTGPRKPPMPQNKA
jgi:hypothetical protein